MTQRILSLSEEEIRDVYEWVDGFNLSRIKRNIARDFADGVLVLEILKEFFPSEVWLNTIVQANNRKDKISNWDYMRSEVTRENLSKGELHFNRFGNRSYC